MKCLTIIAALLHITFLSNSQVIKGIVLDSQTKDTISFASVYFSGTFTGSHTDEQGRFTMDLKGRELMPLTISAIGYYSVTITEFPKSEIIVLLEPKLYEMSAVVVNAESLLKERESNLRIFRREFLGSSVYGKKCEILNEKDITFNYGLDEDTLIAFSKNLIRIHNPLLGYDIACFLDDFRYCRKTHDVLLTGFVLFEQDIIDSSDMKRIIKRRRHAYLGSPTHFFRSLWTNNVHKAGFGGYNALDHIKGKSLYKQTVVDSAGVKFFFYDGFFGLTFNNNVTVVKFNAGPVAFNETGQYDFTKIIWHGKMAGYRVGDWLPLEYKP